MARLPYAAGDWVVVPLADGTFAPARVVRLPAQHHTLTYVFAPRTTTPSLDEVRDLHPGEAVLAVEVSGLAIGRTWPVLGGREDFDPTDWPLPEVETEVPFPDGPRLRVERLDESLRRVGSRHVPVEERGRRQIGDTLGSAALERWMPVQLQRGALVPVREQVWWPSSSSTGPAGSPDRHLGDVAPGGAPGADPVPVPDLVKVVLPGPAGADAARSVEPLLRIGLGRTAEVDGMVSGPAGGEVWVYPGDVARTVDAIGEALRSSALPDGSHLLVRAGGDEVRVDLR